MYCLTSQSYFQYSYTGLHLGEGGGKRGHSLSPLPESNSNPHLSLKLTIPYQYVLLNVVTSFILARSKIFLHGGKPPDCLYKQSMRTGGMPLYTFVPRSHTAVPNSQHCVRPGNKTSDTPWSVDQSGQTIFGLVHPKKPTFHLKCQLISG